MSEEVEQKLRVIQVVNVRWVNATAWYGLFLSRLLKEAGHEVLVLGLGGTASFALAREWGLEPVALALNTGNPLKQISLYRELRQLVASFKPQVVNCHRGESFALWGLLKKAVPGAHFALIRTRGDQRPIRNNLVNRKLYAGVSDALIATNSIIARSMTADLGAAPSRVHTVFGGVDEKCFYPDRAAGREARSALGFGADDFVVGLLGRLDPVKGHEVLIRAVGLLKERLGSAFNIKLLLVGAPSSLRNADIEQMLLAAGLAGCAVITGKVDNVRAHINAMDLGVLASVSSEAIARAALEIMVCGVPLLSSDAGVMPDLLPDAALTPAGDAAALAECLEACWRDAGELQKLTRIAEQAVSGLKSGDFLERTARVYADCVKNISWP